MELSLNNNQIRAKKDSDKLFGMLDRGIDDMESGRELPLDEAFERITELRNMRRNARAKGCLNMGSHFHRQSFFIL